MIALNTFFVCSMLFLLAVQEESTLLRCLYIVVLILNAASLVMAISSASFEEGRKSVPKHVPAKAQPVSAEMCYNWWFTPDNRLNKAKQLKADLCKR